MPSARVVTVSVYAPLESAVAWPSAVSPLRAMTVAFASAVPLSAGVLSLVGVVPVSVGAFGAAVSTTNDRLPLAALVLPVLSAAVAVIVYVPSANAVLGVKL